MFIKCQTTQNESTKGYRLFETDEFQWNLSTGPDAARAIPDTVVSEVFRDEVIKHNPNWTLITFFDGESTPREIFTQLPVYILNNNGQTIDRI